MKRHAHLGLFIPFLLAVLLANSAFPQAVQADVAATPTPTGGTVNTAQPPSGGGTPTATPQQSLPTATQQQTLPTPTAGTSPTDVLPTPTAALDTPTPGGTATDTTPVPTLTESAVTPSATEDGTIVVPEGTPMVVLDSDGNEVPLASSEAADIIATGDPIWCPTGHLPGDIECVEGATVTALVALLASASGGGTVYFMATYANPDATFDGSTLSGLTDLTIQGGWNGGTGGSFGLSGTTDFSTSLSIINWNGDVSLNDLVFSGTSSDGLSVTTTGDIELDNVESSGNTGSGAHLNNTSGGSTVHVNVTGSSFHNNGTGLQVYTNGDVSLAQVDASYNTGTGASIIAGGESTLSQSSFSWNGLNGLTLSGTGDVSLVGIDARNNGGTGAQVSGGADLTIDDSSFDLNAGSGLDAQAANMLTLTDVQANGNDGSGVALIAGRDATLKDVEASQNGGQGAAVWAAWNITVESSAFADNSGDGVNAYSLNGDIAVDCSSFENNGGYGVNADTHGRLDLTGDTFKGNTAGDYHITSGGTVSVGASDNCPSEETPTPTPTATLPLNVVRVVEGEPVTLDCTRYSGTVLILPNGDQALLPCPITGEATLETVFSQDLPEPLDPGLTFLSGMRLQVTPPMYGMATIDFILPLNQDVTNLSILRWDEAGWSDLGGIRSREIYFEASSSQDGVFALVTR